MLETLRYPSAAAGEFFSRLAARKAGADPEIESRVREIIAAVRREGDAALLRYTREFDAPGLDGLLVTPDELAGAEAGVGADFLSALGRAAGNIEDFHRRELPRSWFMTREDGSVLGQRVGPVERAGCYVPGGRGGETPLISTVLMCALPARIAGVGEIVMTTPSRKDGTLSPHLLAAARRAGVTRVVKCGGPWAIAALAYGTSSVPRVDVVVGPGNAYVTCAKRLVSGEVGMEGLAGPSEICIVADGTADPDCIAADLLSQAEHDADASAILVTFEEDLPARVAECLERRLSGLPRSGTARAALRAHGAALVVSDLDSALSCANAIAPEHLELHVADPWGALGKVRHAGAVFLGPHTPEAVGDYFAGANHVLPTAGTARFASALGVETFMKRTNVVSWSREALLRDAPDIARLARLENLEAHARSVEARGQKK